MTMFEPTDAYLAEAREHAHDVFTGVGIFGYGTATLWDGKGEIKQVEPFTNKISDNGDFYYATRAAAGVQPTGLGVWTNLMNGVKLGTDSTAPLKATLNFVPAASYISTSKRIFNTIALSTTGTGTGYQVTYTTTWPTGGSTLSAIVEAAICYDATVDAFSTAANTISRVVFSSVTKTSTDTFSIAWVHTFLGG